jgi:sortase (surface protein transpeptidase)
MTAQSESSRNAVLAAMCQLYPNMNPRVHAQKLSHSCNNQTHFQKHKENKPPKRAAQEQAKNHAEMMEKYNSVISGDVQAPKVQLSFLFY